MAWIQIDDHFDEHPKLLKIGPLGWGVWLAGLAYCNRNLTNGFIPFAKATLLADFDFMDSDGTWYMLAAVESDDDLVPMKLSAPVVIDLLLGAGVWEKTDGGFHVHDYEDWQRSKEEILELREKRSEAGRQGGLASVQAKRVAKSKQVLEQTSSKPSSKIQAKFNPQPNKREMNSGAGAGAGGGAGAGAPARDAEAPPPPPNVARGGARAYVDALGEAAAAKILTDFERIDPDLSRGWLLDALAQCPAGLERTQLVKGLRRAHTTIARAFKTTDETYRPRNPRAFGTAKLKQAFEDLA